VKISSREIGLAWFTAIVLVLAGTYFFVQPRVDAWKEAVKADDNLQRQRRDLERTAERRPEVDRKLADLRKQLPQHPAGKDVTAELLKTLERTAQASNLVLLRREPEKEKNVEDLYEVAINCQWEGDLEAVVRFLYALQVQGAILDVSQLTMSPASGGPGRLKGNFSVDCAYSRTSAGLDAVETTPVPPK
jgi:Tfp pilus assembly protein PilO